MDTYNPNRSGISGDAFDRWVQRSDLPTDSAITKMQHQYWLTKQTLSRKLGKKEDECIVASDAELDAKLELFRSIQESCAFLQHVIDKYQERLCNLAHEENAMGRFLKETGKQDKTRAGKMMSAVGKSLSYSGQQRLALRVPLVRLYQEVETFRRRAIEDTLQNVQSMEKARTEYRAALSWMKDISQELDPDTSKQLERFRKVQIRVRRDKKIFDHQALDCLQKVDLLAAARCNMFSHALVLYQNTLLNFTSKSAQAYATIANSFKGYQQYDFTIVKELAETSSKLAKETNDDDKLLFFEEEYHDSVEEAQEASAIDNERPQEQKQLENELINIDTEPVQISSDHFSDIDKEKSETKDTEVRDEFFTELLRDKEEQINKETQNLDHHDLEKSLLELDLAMDSFCEKNSDLFDSRQTSSLTSRNSQENIPCSKSLLTSESASLLENIFDNKNSKSNTAWDLISGESFMPSSILKQSLAAGQDHAAFAKTEKKEHSKKSNDNSWLDLFAELDPLSGSNSIESLRKREGQGDAPA